MRAWRHLRTFAGRSTFRAWLYRIATNVCLSRRSRRPAERPLPDTIAQAVAMATEPGINLSPYPDAWLDQLEPTSGDPETEYDLRESVQLAFLAAVQLLPARQRAVLILRDVLGWSASEVADMLDTTAAGVNNALHRARATIEQQRAAGRLQSSRVVATDTQPYWPLAYSLIMRHAGENSGLSTCRLRSRARAAPDAAIAVQAAKTEIVDVGLCGFARSTESVSFAFGT